MRKIVRADPWIIAKAGPDGPRISNVIPSNVSDGVRRGPPGARWAFVGVLVEPHQGTIEIPTRAPSDGVPVGVRMVEIPADNPGNFYNVQIRIDLGIIAWLGIDELAGNPVEPGG